MKRTKKIVSQNGVKVTAHSKGYRKMVGGHLFHLGQDQAKALTLAVRIKEVWRMTRSPGRKGWDEDALALAKNLVQLEHGRELEAPPPMDPSMAIQVAQRRNRPIAPLADLKGPLFEQPPARLSEAIKAFEDRIQDSENRSKFWKDELCRRVGLVQDTLGDMPLAEFGHDAISKLVETWAGRCKGRKAKWSPETLKDLLRAARQFVDWLDCTEKFKWEAPRRFERLFKIPPGLPPAVRHNHRAFTVEELQQLYQAAWSDRLRLLLLLGLQCGFYQSDCASLTGDMCHLDEKDPFISRPRGKTGQPGRWGLWPETADLLKAEKRKTRRSGSKPLLLNEDGELLVRGNEDGQKLDSVRLLWRRLLAKCGFSGRAGYGYKYLRKTGSQLVRTIGGHELAEAFLAHKTRGIGAHYHEFLDWTRLDEAIMKMREQLAKMFEPVVEGKEADRGNRAA